MMKNVLVESMLVNSRLTKAWVMKAWVMNALLVKGAVRILAIAALGLSVATAEEGKPPATGEVEIRRKLLGADPEMPITRISKSRVPGFYEVVVDGLTLHVNDTGDHFFAGDLYFVEPDRFVNATEENRSNRRKELLDALEESEMVVFAPPADKVKATITVFTDIDCGYCRQLHVEVPELNGYGIAVRYLAFPRAGIGSESYDKIVSAWCADDPQLALTQAKAGVEIEKRTCANPVASQYAMVDDFGVSGTPAILFEDGRLQSGYAPAEEMARLLGVLN